MQLPMKPTVGSDSVRKGFSAAWRGKHFTSGDDGTVRLFYLTHPFDFSLTLTTRNVVLFKLKPRPLAF